MTCTSIILAGGKSSRMGTDKGLLPFLGKPMIRHVLDAVAPLCAHTICIANSSDYEAFGVPVFPDLIPDSGPMGGIYTGLKHSTTAKNLVLACDTPFIQTEILDLLLRESAGFHITLATLNGRLEPLFAVYDQACLPKIEFCLEKKDFKLQILIDLCENMVKKVEMSEIAPPKFFANLNSPQDLNKFGF